MPDKAFVNPQWDKYAIVYYSGDWVSKTEFAGSTQATCYHTLEDAYDQSGLDTFYIYNDPDSPLSLVAPSGTYVQTNSCYITKNLYVHADTFQLEYSTYEKGLNIYGVTVDFRVSNSFKVVDTKARLNVANGAYFQLGANEGVTSVFLDNCGTVYVESASFSAPSVTNSREISLNEASFSVASVTNTGDGTFKVKGTSSLTIGALSGTILTDSTAATTLNASSISGGAITAQNALNFTGANTLNGVTLNAAGNTVTVGTAEGDSLTLSGTSTLKDSNINGSSISAQGNLTFSGANTLNGVTLDAAGNTVTVGTDEGDSLTVGGTSTLTIGTLNGEIKTAANTTLQNSNISGGGTNGGAITAQGAITVNNSTITSSKFTATKAIGADFSGACILDSVKLDAGTWDSVNVSVDGTLTIKGETTLKIASIFAYNGTIYLDGATIKDSSIVGGQSGAYGGTLVVESGKTATFSTSSNAYSNNFGRTSISNSGSITVNGLMTCGTIDNTNGTIALNGGSKLTSGISGGNITTSDTGIVTVQYSTISSSAFTATADEVIFYDQNTLNSVTLNATAENTTVKANGTLTVGGTSTLNIGTLDGTIKTGSAGTTLTGSDITGGGANGGTITALGTLTFANYTHLRDITLDAHDQTVDAGYNLWLGSAITLNIGTLISTILLNKDTTFTNSTISNGNDSSRLYIYGGKAVTFAGANTIFDAKVHATGRITNDGSITVESNDDKGELTVYRIENSGSITVGSAGSANEVADACSLTATLLNNGGTITVNGENQSNRSLLDAAYITNGDNSGNTGMMWLTNSVLNATRLTNYGRGTFDPGPPRTSQAAITISDSIVSITDSLTNGAANNTSATIEFNNSTVTADSVTNYGIDNGTGGNTGRAGFIVNDSTFTANNTLTNHGWLYVFNSTLHATSLVNNGNRFYVYGTSTLNIGTLTGRIDIINGNDTGSLVTLTDSHITGKVNDDGSLGSSIYVSNPLTFTGTNTLTNTQFYATAANKTVTVDSGATLTVKGTSKLNIASLDGTILTDSEAATTLNNSNITGSGTNGGTISARNSLTFTGTNTLNGITLNAAGKTVTVDSGATLTINAATGIAAGSIGGSGTIVLSTTAVSARTDANTLVSVTENNLSGVTLKIGGTTVTETFTEGVTIGGTTYMLVKAARDIYLTTQTQDTLCVNSAWRTAGTGDLVSYTDSESVVHTFIYGYNAFATVAEAKAVSPSAAIEISGSIADAMYFDGVPGEVSSATLNKNLYGGRKYTAAYLAGCEPDSDGFYRLTSSSNLTVTDSSCQFTSGGSLLDAPGTRVEVTGDANLVIRSGSFSDYLTAGADKVKAGTLNRNGRVTLKIQGGSFGKNVGAGILSSGATIYYGEIGYSVLTGTAISPSDSTLLAIDTEITGGKFAAGTWFYGGSFAELKNKSDRNTINGNVVTTINSSTLNGLTMSNIVAGSHGYGAINGDVELVFKGKGIVESDAYLTITGEIWGGCSGDSYEYTIDENDIPKRTLNSNITGSRILSFTGFEGTLDCTKIRAFSDINFTGGSEVKLNRASYDLSEIENWSFEYGSSLMDSNFANDFTGDTLNLDPTGWGWASAEDDWTILENSRSGAFAGFDSFGSVSFGTGEGSGASYSSSSDVWYNDNYVLYRSSAEPAMILTTRSSYETRFEVSLA